MTTEALGVDIYIPVTFATGGTPVNNFGTAPTLLSAARNGTAFTPSSTTVSANGTSAQSYGYTLQGAETTLQGAGKYTLVFQCLDAAADYPIWLVELEIGQAWVTAISTIVNRLGAFTGSGINTALGFLKALMSKSASTPSDVGGTFDASTDSVEAVSDYATDIQGRIPASLTGSGNIKADALAINGSTTAAAQLARSAAEIVNGAAVAGTLSITQMSTNLTESVNDHHKGKVIYWTSGTLKNQATDITAYNGTTKVLTFTAVTSAPQAGDTFVVI